MRSAWCHLTDGCTYDGCLACAHQAAGITDARLDVVARLREMAANHDDAWARVALDDAASQLEAEIRAAGEGT